MSSMHPVNHAGSVEPSNLISNQATSAESAEFLQRTSATQECGQKVIDEIGQNSPQIPSPVSEDADLAIFGDLLSVTEDRVENEAQTENGKQLESLGGETVAQGGMEKLESIHELVESAKLLDHVVAIADISGDKVTVVPARGLEGSHLKGVFENNQAAVIHEDKLYVHPGLGLAHGQKVTLSDGRTLTVQHFSEDLWKKLSNAVMNYISLISQKDNGDEEEKVKKEHDKAHVKTKITLNPHQLHNKKAHRDERTREVREISRDSSLEKQIEKGVVEARILAHITAAVNLIIEKHIIKIEDQNKRFDDHHREVLLDTLKTDHHVRPIPRALLGRA